MPLFQWFHRRVYSHETQREDEPPIPSLTIQCDNSQAVPFPTVSTPSRSSPSPSSTPFLSRLRRVASCLSFSRSSPPFASPPTNTRTTKTTKRRGKARSTLSISTSFARGRAGEKTLKSCISYPVLRSSSSPISSSDSFISNWGKRDTRTQRKMKEEEEEERHSSLPHPSSVYGLEQILRLSLCPPHLFPEDYLDSTFSSSSHHSSRASTGSSDEVSLSLFDEDSLLLLSSPNTTSTTTYYPHQPVVCSSAASSPARSRLHTRPPSPVKRLPNEIEGFSFSPTPSTSAYVTPTSTPARSIEGRDEEPTPPATPKLSGQAGAASPSSPLQLPPSSSSILSHSLEPGEPSHRFLFERNSGQWLGSTSPTRLNAHLTSPETTFDML